jgi:hypothetical protein
LGVPEDRWIAPTLRSIEDGVTLTLPLGLAALTELAAPGDLALLLAAGSGISAGAALYRV